MLVTNRHTCSPVCPLSRAAPARCPAWQWGHSAEAAARAGRSVWPPLRTPCGHRAQRPAPRLPQLFLDQGEARDDCWSPWRDPETFVIVTYPPPNDTGCAGLPSLAALPTPLLLESSFCRGTGPDTLPLSSNLYLVYLLSFKLHSSFSC